MVTGTGFVRGHEVYWDDGIKKWKYIDTNKLVDKKRPCKSCGHLPTKDGYDFCLGYIPNVKSACCGHGVEKSFIIKE